MGYRGKVAEQEQARELRAQGKTLLEIATQLEVSKSSVSLWVRDVLFTPSKRRYGPQRRRQPLREARLRMIEEFDAMGRPTLVARRSGVPRGRCRAVRGRRRETGRSRAFREHRRGDDALLLRVAAALLQDRRVAAARARVPARRTRPRCGRGALVGGYRRPALAVQSAVSSDTECVDTTYKARVRLRVRRLFVCEDASSRDGLGPRFTIIGLHSGVAQ